MEYRGRNDLPDNDILGIGSSGPADPVDLFTAQSTNVVRSLPALAHPQALRAVTTSRDALSAGSCSQILTTVQPSFRSSSSICPSRSVLRRNFCVQNSTLLLGTLLCSSQPCQKQPSTNTASRHRVKARSARQFTVRSGLYETLNRKPRLCNCRRSTTSGPVSLVAWRLILALIVGEVGDGEEIGRDGAGATRRA
jgi:hypothetical protein